MPIRNSMVDSGDISLMANKNKTTLKVKTTKNDKTIVVTATFPECSIDNANASISNFFSKLVSISITQAINYLGTYPKNIG